MTPDYDFEHKPNGATGMLLCFVAFIALFMFSGLNPLRGSEDRWAEIPREMLLTGDFLHPAVNWQVSHLIPPLSFWLVLPGFLLFGFNEFAVRIPSGIAAIAGLYGTLELARLLFDRKTARLSGWLLVSCYGFLFWGRTASADTEIMALTVLMVWWFYHLEQSPRFWKYLVLYIFAALGISCGSLFFCLIPLLFLVPHLVKEKNWKIHLNTGHFFALCIGLLLVGIQLYLALKIAPAEGLQQMPGYNQSLYELLPGISQRITQVIKNPASLVDALPLVARLLLPWTIFFLFSLGIALFRFKTLETDHRKLFCGGLLLTAAFICFVPARWNHFLPLVPFCCIFTAAIFYQYPENRGFDVLIHFMRWLLIISGSLAFASPIMLPVFHLIFKHFPPLLPGIAIPVAGFLVLMICMLDDKPGNPIERRTGIPCRLASVVLGMAVASMTIFGAVLPGVSVYRTEKNFILETQEVLAGIPEKNIAFYGTRSTAKFLFYLRWENPVCLLTPDSAGSDGLVEFIRARKGESVAIICRGRPDDLFSLKQELFRAGLDSGELQPVKKEAVEEKPWTVFLLDIPENIASGAENTVSKLSEKNSK